MRWLTLPIGAGQAGKPVSTLLRRELGLSAAGVRRAKALLGGILLDGAPVFTNAVARQGQVLAVDVGDAAGSEQIAPVPGPLTIVYEDQDLVILDKAGGVPVHPSQGHHGDTLANFLLAHYRDQGLTAAFHPVNRLDRGTSGLMAVAKHAHAHEGLQHQLQEGTLRRAYLAVCEGVPVPRRGCVEAPIARAPGSVLKREVNPQGAPARTHYEVLATGRGRSLVALRLDTGRTHQIRVHLAHLGCPLVGDFLYGEETEELPDRFALHSAAIWLRQPITGEGIVRRSPLPEALAGLEAALAAPGLRVKLNCVPLAENRDQWPPLAALARGRTLDVRFIELMPMGPCAAWPESCFVPASTVLEAAPQLVPAGQNGVAQQYQVPGWRGSVGLISPMHHRFCGQCNRIRVLANGNLKPCLHAAAEYPLRGLPPEALRAAIAQAILQKPQQHTMDAHHASRSCRNMHEIGG